MAEKKHGKGKGRKTGDWKAIEQGRARNKNRFLVTSRGLSNVPVVGEIGSAAYRRLIRKGHKTNAAKRTSDDRVLEMR